MAATLTTPMAQVQLLLDELELEELLDEDDELLEELDELLDEELGQVGGGTVAGLKEPQQSNEPAPAQSAKHGRFWVYHLSHDVGPVWVHEVGLGGVSVQA